MKLMIRISLAVLLFSSAGFAQATRTWVSGVGDDVNPCSRTSPCKTFAGAISKTAAGGEISVLDPGGFGAVTITKSITINGEGTLAGILAASVTGVVINAGASDSVVLRNLFIEGSGTSMGLHGIRFLAGGSLIVEKCFINQFRETGIAFIPSTTSQLHVRDTVIRNVLIGSLGTNGGILIAPTGAAQVTGTIENTQLLRNRFGLRVEDNVKMTVKNTTSANNTFAGFSVVADNAPVGSIGGRLRLDNCTSANNQNGVRAASTNGATAEIHMSNCFISDNTQDGLVTTGIGQIISYGNNSVMGNSPNGAATLTPGQI